MRTDIYLGVDFGSTALKAVAFEAGSGRVLAARGGPLPHARLPGGGCELAEADLHAALGGALSQVATALGERVVQVRAIGCTGHGGGLFALGADGRLLRGVAVSSTDQRGAARARALAERHGPRLAREVGCAPWPGQTTVLAAELLGTDVVRRGELAQLMFAKDYLGWLLTGEATTEASDASTAGLLSLADGAWSDAAWEASGIDGLSASHFPRRVRAGSVVGRLGATPALDWGLPAGLPVVTSTIDLLAGMHAVRATASGDAVAVLGTWCVNAVVGPVRSPSPPVESVVHFGEADRRLYMENSPSGMANLGWLARLLGLPGLDTVIDLAMSVPAAESPRCLPFIHGGNTPPMASAGFVGLQAAHGPAHLARAAVQAVAALHARHLARLAPCSTTPGVTVMGGGARDRRLVQLLAGFLGHPVQRCDDESGARGAALHAAVSQGLGEDALPAPMDVVAPDPAELAPLAAARADFDALLDAMAPAFRLLAAEAPR